MRKIKKILTVFIALVTFSFIAILIFARVSTYKASEEAKDQISLANKNKNVYEFLSDDPVANIIFYPGGFVDPIAYSIFLYNLSKESFNVYLVDMPLNLAIINLNAAKKIIDRSDSSLDWYIGGHSLGGASASIFVQNNKDLVKGVYFLGAYAADSVDLLNLDIKMTYIYGSNDLVLNMSSINAQYELLNSNENFHVINGGNHAFFGHYGFQKGDGIASVDRYTQQQLTISILKNWINN